MATTTQRKQAPRLPRPAARYWKGKAPKGVADVESDSDLEEREEVEQQNEETGDVLIRNAEDVGSSDEEDNRLEIHKDSAVEARTGLKGRGMNLALKDVNVSKDGKVIVAGRLESGKTEMEDEESSEESSEEEELPVGEEESEEDSSEYESESEEEAPKPLFRPVFVPKRARVTVAEKEAMAEDSEEARRKKELEAEERRKQSHDMVAESIRRELAEKEKEDQVPDVDDTDGLDPAAEFEAWRLRELSRIKKEKEEELKREQEREEVERRRALPEEQRLKEDLERAEKSRKEKPKGQQKFLQKYWHKGAFHQDDEVLKKHDYTEATESTADVTLLPKVMQVKNFGKRGRTKYTHLVDQDTTVSTGGFGGTAPVKSGGTGLGGGGCFLCGGPHLKKDCPQNIERANTKFAPKNDNDFKAQDSRHRDQDRPRDSYNSKDRYRGDERRRDDRYERDNRDRYGDQRDYRRHYRPSSRSRSPLSSSDRYRTRGNRRSRERSVDYDYDHREKRRRMD